MSKDAKLEPLRCVVSIVWKALLQNFTEVLKSDSFVEFCHRLKDGNEDLVAGVDFTVFIELASILLLDTIRKELTTIPSHLIFSNSTANENLNLSSTQKS